MDDEDRPKFEEAKTFDEWFDLNEDLIHEMHRNDAYELLYEAWFAGYSAGLETMANMASPLWPKPLASGKLVDDLDD